MKCLFLGGTSFIGRELIKSLSRNKATEIWVYLRSQSSEQKIETPGINFLYDFNQRNEFDVVFNLIADYGKGKSLLSDVMSANVLFPLKAIEKIQFKTIVNFSTALPYELSSYSLTKKILEDSLTFEANQKGFQFLNLKIQQFFGPGAPENNFVTMLIKKMLRNDRLDLTDGLHKRDFVFVADLIKAVEIILNQRLRSSKIESFEIGSGESITIKELVYKLKEITKSDSELNFGAIPKRNNEPENLIADVKRLIEIGWKTSNLNDALAFTVQQERNKN